MRRTRVFILGAAGRDFHNFNVVYREDAASEVIAFTAAQIPGIAQCRYPRATVVRGASPVTLEDPAAVRGKAVLAVDDGPTLTIAMLAFEMLSVLGN